MNVDNNSPLRWLNIVGLIFFVAIIVFAGWASNSTEKPIPLGMANGSYATKACGLITFNNGVVRWNGANAVYTLDTDKIGLFALTDHFVWVKVDDTNCTIWADNSKLPLKLRFDDNQHSRTLTLWDAEKHVTVDFTRQP